MEALKYLLGWGEAEYLARRDIIHENKNEAQKSIASARTLRKASDEAFRVAQCLSRYLKTATIGKMKHERVCN
jgi:hypothetical protein